jgi:hypothetical protein
MNTLDTNFRILMTAVLLLAMAGCDSGDDGSSSFDTSSVPRYADPGPYPVGVTSLDLGDRFIEVWYPADPGSEVGVPVATYTTFDVFFEVLPETFRRFLETLLEWFLPPELKLSFDMQAYRDVPVSADSPFPVLTFSHGRGGFRLAYSSLLAGIASHGFVIASIDHLEWGLLATAMGLMPDPERDAGDLVLATLDLLEVENSTADGRFEGWVDTRMAATVGHSLGRRAAFAHPEKPEIVAMVGYATGSTDGVSTGKPTLLLVGEEDEGAESLEEAYEGLIPVKRFVSIGKAGHNSFTDQCATIHGGNNFIETLVEMGLPLPDDIVDQALNGCMPENLSPPEVWRIVQHFTVAHLRAAFGIDDRPVGLGSGITEAFEGVEILYRSEDQGYN